MAASVCEYLKTLASHYRGMVFEAFVTTGWAVSIFSLFKKKKNDAILFLFTTRHSEEMVQRLESAGLGYHVGAKQTYEKIGKLLIYFLLIRNSISRSVNIFE